MNIKNKLVAASLFSASALFSMQAFAVSDSDITDTVKDRLEANATTEDSDVDVSTKDGVVTLSGKLETQAEASTAIEIADSVPGVKDVESDNLLTKDSTHPVKDAYTTAKVKGSFLREKLFGDKPVSAFTIHVETKNGVVHLTGTAESKEQIATAIKIAKGIKGVSDVKSTVEVKK